MNLNCFCAPPPLLMISNPHNYLRHEIAEMAKGRRERDRPKAAPGSLYNPNKRVKLSYDSESEGDAAEEEKNATVEDLKAPQDGDQRDSTGAKDQLYSSAHVDATPPEQDLPVASTETLLEDEQDGEDQEGEADSANHRRKNHHTGQLHALGALSWEQEGDEEDDGGSPDPAMEYLRAVRLERQTIPHVLSGSHLQAHANDYGDDFAGFAKDHAVIGAPDAPIQRRECSSDPREAFTSALKKRFSNQRHQLHLPPSSKAVAALEKKHPITLSRKNENDTAKWLEILASTPPVPAQVRSLDQDCVFTLLELIQNNYLQRQKDVNLITSAWIWSLLARLDEVGTMDNDQVYPIRAFGKKAVLVQVSFRSSEAATQLEELANAEAGASKVQSQEVFKDSAQINVDGSGIEVNKQGADRENTLATLDTILVIVGDVFGQRDLLEFRQPWEVDKDLPKG